MQQGFVSDYYKVKPIGKNCGNGNVVCRSLGALSTFYPDKIRIKSG
jgi:hypothetical protein